MDLPHLGDVVVLIVCLLVTIPGSLQQQGGFTAPCTWTNTNGSVINLSSVGFTNGTARWTDLETVTPDSDPNTYSVNPCHGFTQSASCQDVAVCKNSGLGFPFNIGDVAEHNMFFSSVENTVILEYTHTDDDGIRRVSGILTVCVPEGEDQITSYGAEQPTQDIVTYRFMLFSRCACYDGCPNADPPTLGPILTSTVHTLHPIVTRTTSPPTGPFTIGTIPPNTGSKGLSAGGVLCVIFVCSVSGYFIMGAAYMFFCAGARGKEIIPNIDFWMDLPNLVFEGLGFLANCCKVDQSSTSFTSTDPSATEYDKI